MEGNQIAMPQPIYDGSVDYEDGTSNDMKQLTEDLVTFLKVTYLSVSVTFLMKNKQQN